MARKSYSKASKAWVALDALKGQKTVNEIASEHKVHPQQVSQWKRKAVEGMSELFARGKNHEVEDLENERIRIFSIKQKKVNLYPHVRRNVIIRFLKPVSELNTPLPAYLKWAEQCFVVLALNEQHFT